MNAPTNAPQQTAGTRGLRVRIGILTIALAGLVTSTPGAAAPTENTDETIRYLIEYIRDSNVTFVRNFSNHTSAEAAEHVEKKYRHFEDKIDTPEEFIELCASKSLMTRTAYNIIDERGRRLPSREWLMHALDAYRNGDGHTSPD